LYRRSNWIGYSNKSFNDFKNCNQTAETPGGTVTRVDAKSDMGTCSNGALQNAQVTYNLTGVTDYEATCKTDNNGNIQCQVVEQ